MGPLLANQTCRKAKNRFPMDTTLCRWNMKGFHGKRHSIISGAQLAKRNCFWISLILCRKHRPGSRRWSLSTCILQKMTRIVVIPLSTKSVYSPSPRVWAPCRGTVGPFLTFPPNICRSKSCESLNSENITVPCKLYAVFLIYKPRGCERI